MSDVVDTRNKAYEAVAALLGKDRCLVSLRPQFLAWTMDEGEINLIQVEELDNVVRVVVNQPLGNPEKVLNRISKEKKEWDTAKFSQNQYYFTCALDELSPLLQWLASAFIKELDEEAPVTEPPIPLIAWGPSVVASLYFWTGKAWNEHTCRSPKFREDLAIILSSVRGGIIGRTREEKEEA